MTRSRHIGHAVFASACVATAIWFAIMGVDAQSAPPSEREIPARTLPRMG